MRSFPSLRTASAAALPFLCLAFLCLAAPSLANDGVDRYRKAVPTTFRLFPDPLPGSGYGVLPRDMEGGADGKRMFRWAQGHAVALVRLAAHATVEDLGPAPNPLLIFDCSAENGDTPVDFDPRPLGRHPGGSHDGGLNLDLGYYLSSLKGRVYTPDYAAATEHFERRPDGTLKDVPQCLGEADKLDLPRTARFLVELFRLDAKHFSGELLEETGVDFQVKRPVLALVREWARKGQHGATEAIALRMDRVLTCDVFEGWARTHHHHLHLRLADLPLLGRHRAGFEALAAAERALDRDLRARAGESAPMLRAELHSSGLERFVEAELMTGGKPIRDLRFRVDGGPWQSAQPGDPRNRCVLELPPPKAMEKDAERACRVEVEARDAQGRELRREARVPLPYQDPRLELAVEPLRISGEVRREGERLLVTPRFPQPWLALVTEACLVVRDAQGERKLPASPDMPVSLEDGPGSPIAQVELRLTCSGRKTLSTLLYRALPR